MTWQLWQLYASRTVHPNTKVRPFILPYQMTLTIYFNTPWLFISLQRDHLLKSCGGCFKLFLEEIKTSSILRNVNKFILMALRGQKCKAKLCSPKLSFALKLPILFAVSVNVYVYIPPNMFYNIFQCVGKMYEL